MSSKIFNLFQNDGFNNDNSLDLWNLSLIYTLLLHLTLYFLKYYFSLCSILNCMLFLHIMNIILIILHLLWLRYCSYLMWPCLRDLVCMQVLLMINSNPYYSSFNVTFIYIMFICHQFCERNKCFYISLTISIGNIVYGNHCI